MDPKSVNNLDPKMKETYDRVMGTSTSQPAAAPVAPAAPSADITAPSAATTPPTTGTPFATAPSVPDNLQFQAAIQSPPSQPAATPVGAAVPNQSSSMLRVLYIVGSIIFFAVYTFFWVKIFNLPLPF